jgi:hypothetical protein
MHAVRWGLLGGVFILSACGDSGRETASVALTEGPGTVTPTTTTTTTPTGSDATTVDDGTASATQGQTTTAPTTLADTTAADTTTTDPDPTTTAVTVTTSDTTDTTDTTTDDPPCQGTGVFDFSYLWVANTSQGSISKINTMTLIEEGRYYADPNPPAASTSRTSVNIDGHFVVVSNRSTGTVTKVAANVDDCLDKNGDGTIQTSQNKDDLLPWGSDECVLWNVSVNPLPDLVNRPSHGPRGTAWAPGDFNPRTCKYENQKVWVGWKDSDTHGYMASFDGATGAQVDTVGLDNWSINVNFAPYGAAADGFGNIWFTAVYEELGRINTTTLELKRWPSGGIQFYGMTVDGKGNVWFGPYNNGNVAYFDAQTETFHEVPGTNNYHRGVAVDADGMVWVATNSVNGSPCGLHQVDSNTNTLVQFHTFPMCTTPVGVSIDVEGFIWMVDLAGWAYRIDPVSYAKDLVTIPGDHYTYSDMTGGGLVGAVIPG